MSFCPSTYVRSPHPNQASHEPAMSQPITRKNLLTRPYFFAKFLVFRIMSAFCRKFSQYIFLRNLCISYFKKISHFLQNRLKRNFTKKRKFSFFPNKMQKCEIFREQIYFRETGFLFYFFCNNLYVCFDSIR